MGNSCIKKQFHCSKINSDKLSKEYLVLHDKYLSLKKKHIKMETEYKNLIIELKDNFIIIRTSKNKNKIF